MEKINFSANKSEMEFLALELENKQPPNGQLIEMGQRDFNNDCGALGPTHARPTEVQEFSSLIDAIDTNTLDKVFYAPPAFQQITFISNSPASWQLGASAGPENELRNGAIGGKSAPSSYDSGATMLSGMRQYEEVRKQKLLMRNGSPAKMCSNCGTTTTPSWRRCPEGKNLLCNACGLYQKLHNKSRPFIIATDGSVKVQRQGVNDATCCTNCQTTETPLWRRGISGECLCNACGLYLKQHNRYRQVKRSESIGAEYCEAPIYYMDNQCGNGIMQNLDMEEFNSQQCAYSSPGIDLNALESLAVDLCVNRKADDASLPYGPAHSLEDKELYDRLQYLEDAAAALLTSRKPPPMQYTCAKEEAGNSGSTWFARGNVK